jgi:rhodanese-related sulfurtransferase
MPTPLFFRQYDLACLSLYSYLIGDTTTGRAVVVDPQRDISSYLADAAANGLRIERVLETHFHAGFLSGHLELAEATGATISYGSVAPLYFAFAADANKRERELLDDHEPPLAITVDEALVLAHAGAVLLDTRAPESFASGHLRGSINVGLDGRFAEYAGDIVRPGQQVVLLGDTGRGTEAKIRLARIGFDAVAGDVPDIETVLASRPELATSARRLPAVDVAAWLADEPDLQIIDVRNPGETNVGGTVPGARNLPLPQLLDHLDDLDPTRPTVVYCAGGYRSSVAASTLAAHGFTHVADLIGGYGAWLTHTNPHLQEA